MLVARLRLHLDHAEPVEDAQRERIHRVLRARLLALQELLDVRFGLALDVGQDPAVPLALALLAVVALAGGALAPPLPLLLRARAEGSRCEA